MGKQKMREARKALAEQGYIRVVKGTPHKEGKRGEPARVYLENVWTENILTNDKSKQAMTVKQRLQSNTNCAEINEDLTCGSGFEDGANQTPSEENGFHQTSSNNSNGSDQTSQQVYPALKEKKEPLNKKQISAPSAQSAAPTARTTYEDDRYGQEGASETQTAKVDANARSEVEERALIKFLNRAASEVGPTVKQELKSTKIGIDHNGNEVEHMSPVDRYDFDPNFRKYVVDQIAYWRNEGNGKIRSKMMPLARSLLNVDTEGVGYFAWCKKHKITRRKTLEELKRYLLPGETIEIDENGQIIRGGYLPGFE